MSETHFKLIIVKGARSISRFFLSFVSGWPVVPTPSVERLSSLHSQRPAVTCSCVSASGLFCSTSFCLFHQDFPVLLTVASSGAWCRVEFVLQHVLPFNVVLAVQDPPLHGIFTLTLVKSTQQRLELWVEPKDYLHILSLPHHKHGRATHLVLP